jgi:signal transduction histidine kinase
VRVVDSPNGFGWFSGRGRRSIVLLLSAAVLGLGLLVVFGIELSNTQAASKANIKGRVHDRAVLTAALVDSLFATVESGTSADERKFGGPTVSTAALNEAKGTSLYVVVLTPSGKLLGSSTGLSQQARAELPRSGTLALLEHGDQYALGNLLPYGKTGVVDLAIGLTTPHGRRVLVEGFPPSALGGFLNGALHRIPGVSGSHNLILDTNDTVIGTNTESRPIGYRYSAASRAALGKTSGERNGRYYDQVPLADSTWRVVLTAPDGPLFASIMGLHRWVPWLILLAFALVALLALALGWRVLYSAERGLEDVNAELEDVNRRLEKSNQQLERRAVELSRSNAELEQFASIASHDLQEPLRKVRTFTEQLTVTESERLSERGLDYLERANRAAERMQGLIQDLLQFSRVTTKPRPFVDVDLNQVASEVLDDLSVEIEDAGAVLSMGYLPTVSADPLQMRQLILNLVSNALKFRRPDVPPEITISGEVVGEVAHLVVADNGIGFEPRYSTRIFKVFERLNGRNDYPGTGIGLALCHKIVTRHGGDIVASSELLAGATFTVTLPLKQTAQPADLPDKPGSDPDDAKEEAHVAS